MGGIGTLPVAAEDRPGSIEWRVCIPALPVAIATESGLLWSSPPKESNLGGGAPS